MRRLITIPRFAPLGLTVLLAVGLPSLSQGTDETPIDPARGRALMQKWQRGEPLSQEESAYLNRVRQEIRRRMEPRLAGSCSSRSRETRNSTTIPHAAR
ncbi:MAG TPA: hypothetical protein VNT26_02415 [Candidatus Sulfotelmatobacter sp.]|nr:hypothetical protein [Candidatus Sulfotelmatobacter sp.]